VKQAIGGKANIYEQKAKDIEKSYLRKEMDKDNFIDAYMKERKEFHKYSFMKVLAAGQQ
jgi:molecular chaperone GrpE (heat shock protein)